jgi:cytidine deaminase
MRFKFGSAGLFGRTGIMTDDRIPRARQEFCQNPPMHNDEDLIAASRDVRNRAYAPYSEYRVGAALRDERGRIWTGCNVENISYGATMCAERTAVGKMISEGGSLVTEIAVATRDGGTPCGICLQTLLEFSGADQNMRVILVPEHGQPAVKSLRELLPYGFSSSDVRRT